MGRNIHISCQAMLVELFLIVLLPLLIGQILRPKTSEMLARYKSKFSIFSQSVILLIILNAVARSSSKMDQLSIWIIVGLTGFMVTAHVLNILFNWGIGLAMRLPRPSLIAFSLHTSQKSLAVAYIVWAGYFAKDNPLSLLPSILLYVPQMIMDTVIAQRLGQQRVAIDSGIEAEFAD